MNTSVASYINSSTIFMNGHCSLILKIPMFKLNHPRIALFQLHHFSWNPYCWWRHHLWMTSLLPFWWRHVTWSHFIWCNFGPSMILPSFITNGSFLEILRQNSWILGVFDSSYQGLLLEGPKRGWGRGPYAPPPPKISGLMSRWNCPLWTISRPSWKKMITT